MWREAYVWRSTKVRSAINVRYSEDSRLPSYVLRFFVCSWPHLLYPDNRGCSEEPRCRKVTPRFALSKFACTFGKSTVKDRKSTEMIIAKYRNPREVEEVIRSWQCLLPVTTRLPWDILTLSFMRGRECVRSASPASLRHQTIEEKWCHPNSAYWTSRGKVLHKSLRICTKADSRLFNLWFVGSYAFLSTANIWFGQALAWEGEEVLPTPSRMGWMELSLCFPRSLTVVFSLLSTKGAANPYFDLANLEQSGSVFQQKRRVSCSVQKKLTTSDVP